jgi:hypothetical protein
MYTSTNINLQNILKNASFTSPFRQFLGNLTSSLFVRTLYSFFFQLKNDDFLSRPPLV